MTNYDIVSSGFSQWVFKGGAPFAVEIFRLQGDELWTLQVVEVLEKVTIWENQLSDEMLAFVEAQRVIETYTSTGRLEDLRDQFSVY
ncbi:MAG: hypothetical protein QNJ44_16325 [Rhodobacter sp.]|nr:hypothetical protein [Rhodobacter sp.]